MTTLGQYAWNRSDGDHRKVFGPVILGFHKGALKLWDAMTMLGDVADFGIEAVRARVRKNIHRSKGYHTDSHWSEPYDLWTSRAPAKWQDRVPQMVERNGKRRWWFDGDIPIGLPIASSVIDPDGEKITGTAFFEMDNEVVHRASFDAEARVAMLDHLGIHAQIMYPNVAGFGNQNFLKSPDETLRLLSVEIYNDALAEFQADTGERVFGMALLPWWNLDAAVREMSELRRWAAGNSDLH